MSDPRAEVTSFRRMPDSATNAWPSSSYEILSRLDEMPCSQAVSTRFQRDSVSWMMFPASLELASLNTSSVSMSRLLPLVKSFSKNFTGRSPWLTMWNASRTLLKPSCTAVAISASCVTSPLLKPEHASINLLDRLVLCFGEWAKCSQRWRV